ncbi:MAG: divergent polysaccharide deacetylase family protein [Campylobacterota bacterium]|nr:divergent polysaccharide deacetylase family protein [Campylobacterota bacterium]
MKKHTHRRAPKKLKRTKKHKHKLFTIISTVFIAILIVVASTSYFLLNNNEVIVDIKKENIVQIKQIKNKPITFEEKTKALEIEYINNVDNNIYIEKQEDQKQKENTFHYEEPDYGKVDEIVTKQDIKPEIIEQPKEEIVNIPPIVEKIKEKKKIKIDKPLLAIIIDDVTTKSQIKKIKNIGYTVNMAFLPPTKGHKSSAKITNKLDKYMIHLPLQASSSRYEEENTLYITDDIETIDKRVKSLQKLYPKAKYLNNHTGSKFTSNKEAMDKLFIVLKRYNYIFVDSRTTASSVASLSAKKYGVRMLSRNIFLDNNKNKKYIQGQLKKAIKNAKKYGSAIAIGHPYNITFKTLKDSKYLLKDVELVYIDRL